MPFNSPLASPDAFVTRIGSLSNEAIIIDKGIGNAKRDAANFASKYSADFSLVTDLKSQVEGFSDVGPLAINIDTVLTSRRFG